MPVAKMIVLDPTPLDVDAFERVYTHDHAPMVTAQNFRGIQKFVGSKVLGAPDGTAPPFCRVAELHFASMETLQSAAASASAQEVVAASVGLPRFHSLPVRDRVVRRSKSSLAPTESRRGYASSKLLSAGPP